MQGTPEHKNDFRTFLQHLSYSHNRPTSPSAARLSSSSLRFVVPVFLQQRMPEDPRDTNESWFWKSLFIYLKWAVFVSGEREVSWYRSIFKRRGCIKKKAQHPAAMIRHCQYFRKVHLTVIKSGREADLQSEFP